MAIRKEYNQSWNPFWMNMPDGGSKNYEDLEKKPSINDVELEGNKTSEQLGLGDVKLSDLAPDFSDETNYEAGDMVISPEGKFCYFPVDHQAGELQPGELVETNVAEQIEMNAGGGGDISVASASKIGGVKAASPSGIAGTGIGMTSDGIIGVRAGNGMYIKNDTNLLHTRVGRLLNNVGLPSTGTASDGAYTWTGNVEVDFAAKLHVYFKNSAIMLCENYDFDIDFHNFTGGVAGETYYGVAGAISYCSNIGDSTHAGIRFCQLRIAITLSSGMIPSMTMLKLDFYRLKTGQSGLELIANDEVSSFNMDWKQTSQSGGVD